MSNHIPPEIDVGNAQYKIYVGILSKIMTGEFGPGYRLPEEELARQFHVSRTPVREVLVLLERDGLIQRVPNCGARVVNFMPEEVENIYEIRKALECCAIRYAATNIKMSDLLELKHQLERANQEVGPSMRRKQEEIDLQLHDLIVKSSGNRRLIAYLENISVLCRCLTLASYMDDHFALYVGGQHLAIVEALIRRDKLESERLLANHISEGCINILGVFHRRNSTQKGADKSNPARLGVKKRKVGGGK
ncbi:MAG: GntR family transcriptional regulator [Acidobacteriaceae bacterium]